MKRINWSRALVAGWASTLIMTIVMISAPHMGMPKMDLPAMLGSLFIGSLPAPGSLFWDVGLVLHLMMGTVIFAAAYARIITYLPTSHPVVKGLTFGMALWLLSQILALPMMGAGFFSSKLPHASMLAMGSLVAHLIYGAALGSIYRHEEDEREARRIDTLGL